MFSGGAEVKNIMPAICDTDKFTAGAEQDQCKALVEACRAKADENTCNTGNISDNRDSIRDTLTDGDAASVAARKNYDKLVLKLTGVANNSGAAPARSAKPPTAAGVADEEDEEVVKDGDEKKLKAVYNSATSCKDFKGKDKQECIAVARLAKAFCNSTLKQRGFTAASDTLANHECDDEEMDGHITYELREALNEWMNIEGAEYAAVRDAILADKVEPIMDGDNEVKGLDLYGDAISAQNDYPIAPTGLRLYFNGSIALGSALYSDSGDAKSAGAANSVQCIMYGVNCSGGGEAGGSGTGNTSEWGSGFGYGGGIAYLLSTPEDRISIGFAADYLFTEQPGKPGRTTDISKDQLTLSATSYFQFSRRIYGLLGVGAGLIDVDATETSKSDKVEEVQDASGQALEAGEVDDYGMMMLVQGGFGVLLPGPWGQQTFIEAKAKWGNFIDQTATKHGKDPENADIKRLVIMADGEEGYGYVEGVLSTGIQF